MTMDFWLTLIGYQVVWFIAITGAGRGLAWPGVIAATVFGIWRLAVTKQRDVDLRLMVAACVAGLLLQLAWVGGGWVGYAAPWPSPLAPAWLMALWLAFGLTLVPLFSFLMARPLVAAGLGAAGGPLSWLSAARGWQAATLAEPIWQSLLALSAGWAIALPLLISLARHLQRFKTRS